jgi:hypothetical protein
MLAFQREVSAVSWFSSVSLNKHASVLINVQLRTYVPVSTSGV